MILLGRGRFLGLCKVAVVGVFICSYYCGVSAMVSSLACPSKAGRELSLHSTNFQPKQIFYEKFCVGIIFVESMNIRWIVILGRYEFILMVLEYVTVVSTTYFYVIVLHRKIGKLRTPDWSFGGSHLVEEERTCFVSYSSLFQQLDSRIPFYIILV